MNWLKIDKIVIFTGTDKNGNRYLSQFLKDYKEVFPNTNLNAGCERCLNDYYKKLIKHISIMKTVVKNNSGYVLKEKYQNIPLKFGSKILINNTNITKKIGDELLKRKNGEYLFLKVPENIKDAKVDKLTKNELNEKATKLGVDLKLYANKKDLIKAISLAEEEIKNQSSKEE